VPGANGGPDLAQRRMVEVMVGVGVPETDIARVLGIDLATLRAQHPEELATGQIIANAKVAESLFRKAIGDGPQSVAAAMFWLKTRAGWSESTVTGNRVDARIEAMSDAELDAAIEEFTRKIEATARNMELDV
jgi:hypothetical protein